MAEAKVAEAPKKENVIQYANNIIRGEENDIGVLIAEEKDAALLKGVISIPLGHEKTAKIGKESVVIFLGTRVPAEINPELYYPVTEWRITQDRLDDADNVPVWKRMPIMYNGIGVRNLGREVTAFYYILLAIQGMEEASDGLFFIEEPFMSDRIKMTDIKLPVIKGSDILAFDEAKKVLNVNWYSGSTRRRGDQ